MGNRELVLAWKLLPFNLKFLASNFHSDSNNPLAGSPLKRLSLPRSVFVLMPMMDIRQMIVFVFFFGVLMCMGMGARL